MSQGPLRERRMAESAVSTPATKLGEFYRVLADHLTHHPDLPPVSTRLGNWLQVSRRGGQHGAHGVLLWAQTMTVSCIEINQHGKTGNRTEIWVYGSIAGESLSVWDVDDGDLWRWLPSDADLPYYQRTTVITTVELAAYVAAGTVERVVRTDALLSDSAGVAR